MKRRNLNVRTLYRKPDATWDDDSLGQDLADLVRRALIRGAAPPAGLCIREDRMDLFDVGQAIRSGLQPHVFLATLTRLELPGAGPIRAVGLIGQFEARQSAQQGGVPTTMVFLEWEDCRWWHWRALLDLEDKQVREETVTVTRATEGDPKPLRLGGWWSQGRRARLKAKMEQMVH